MKTRSLFLILATAAAFRCSPILAGEVTTDADAGPGSLRQAIRDAAMGETITFHQSLIGKTITLTSTQLVIDKNLTILGPGPDKLAISANHLGRVIVVVSVSGEVTLSGLKIADGSISNDGAGILNQGTLTVRNCNVTGNSGRYGGGIANWGFVGRTVSLTVIDSTISGNLAEYGGGIYNIAGDSDTSLWVESSTISGNSARYGGGIVNQGTGVSARTTVYRSTISGNSSAYGSAIYNNADVGNSAAFIVDSTISGNRNSARITNINGAVLNETSSNGGRAVMVVANSTLSDNIGNAIANNFGAELSIGSSILKVSHAEFTDTVSIVNTFSSKLTSLGYNLASDGGVWNRVGGTGAFDQVGDQLNTDPLLGPLKDNGGPTFTHAPFCASPAIDQGKNLYGAHVDQRGFVRFVAITGSPIADGTDIGAFEAQVTPPCNRPPVARCKDVTVWPGSNCMADVSIDNGSFDPDGDSITLSQSPPGPFALGATSVTLTVTDRQGASSTAVATVTVVDNTPPTIHTRDITVALGASGTATITPGQVFASGSDNCSLVSLVSVTPSSFTCGNIGANSVTLKAQDEHGNIGAAFATVTVVHNPPPISLCPPDQSANATSSLGATVIYPPSATDPCNSLIIGYSRLSGILFPIGDTTVTITVTDRLGNSNACSFNVHVKGAVEQIHDLIAKVNTLTQIKDATRHHLLVKLEAALSDVASGHAASACHQMTDFMSATKAHENKQLIPASIADDLIVNGVRIKVVLSCP